MTGSRLEALYRDHATRLIARLIRVAGGRVDLAEAAVHDAFLKAGTMLETEVPAQPEAWLYRVAKNRLIDLLRREEVARRAQTQLEPAEDVPAPEATLSGEWDDELLQMIIAVCHPALTPDEQVALALRILCGLPLSSIARIFGAEEPTLKKRLTSGKRKLREAGPLEAPVPRLSEERMPTAMRVLYVLFTEGHKPRSGSDALREDLCQTAIVLGQILLRALPSDSSTRHALHALLALMNLVAARLPARRGPEAIVLLEHQDRSKWDQAQIDAGLRHLEQSQGEGLTPYHHEAMIAACHCLASDFVSTDWKRIVAGYDALLATRPSLVLEVNRAVAIGFRDGFEAGVAILQALPRAELVGHLPFHAALASLLERAGDAPGAAAAYRVATNLSTAEVDRTYFAAKAEALTKA